ncbi:MAG: sulfite exporter TauE/SafE family protein [Pseudomonadota bacterium]
MMHETLIAAAFVAGFAGSGHCLGMCGPIVGLMESTPLDRLSPAARRTGYQLGRLIFYVSLGSFAAFASATITQPMGVQHVTMLLRILAAVILMLIGVKLVLNRDSLKFLDRAGRRLWQLLSPLTRHVLPMDNFVKAIGGGFLWGALPCGLVYSAVAIAAVTASPLHGALVMLAFWAGTLPALLGIGLGTRQLLAGRFRKLAGVTVIATACISLVMLVPMSNGEHSHDAHSQHNVAEHAHH